VVEYHGLAQWRWYRRCLLVRPQLNGDTLGRRRMLLTVSFIPFSLLAFALRNRFAGGGRDVRFRPPYVPSQTLLAPREQRAPYLILLLPTLMVFACAKPDQTADSPGYGYENVDDPLAEADAAASRLPTSCAQVRCPPPQVCRRLSVSDPGGDAHAYCLLPGDGLCKDDPEICQDSVCQTQPGLCK
jgi:hypothetical protein